MSHLSVVEDIVFPALPGQQGASLLAALWQFEQTQWWSAERLRCSQQDQLRQLLDHAMLTVPFYQQRLSEVNYQPGQAWDEDMWSALPVLKRQQVQQFRDRLQTQRLPKGHGNAYHVQSSGSTGRPVQVLGSDVTRFYWNVVTLRDNHWRRYDYTQNYAAVRPDGSAKKQDRLFYKGRGIPVDLVYHAESTMTINSRVDVRQQLQWLKEYKPVYLTTLPSNLRELLRLCEQDGNVLPDLKQVRCLGETVTRELRDYTQKVWGVDLSDIYSSQEVGYMALQCPEHDHYHVQSETVYFEVLDDNNQTCAPGEIGRVVVTPLHNFATPLIRYEVGDYAEVGDPCPCGRGLPVLKKIMGRSRNMVRTPEGKCYWPSFPVDNWLAVADIHQFQLKQVKLDEIEAVVAMNGEMTEEKEKLLVQKLQRSLGYPFKISFRYVEEISVQKNGKYEDFISLL